MERTIDIYAELPEYTQTVDIALQLRKMGIYFTMKDSETGKIIFQNDATTKSSWDM